MFFDFSKLATNPNGAATPAEATEATPEPAPFSPAWFAASIANSQQSLEAAGAEYHFRRGVLAALVEMQKHAGKD